MSIHVRSCSNILKHFKTSVCVSYYSTVKANVHPVYQHKSPKQVFAFKVSTKFQQHWFHTSYPFFESVTVNCPAFAESISEGDVRWEKAAGDSVNEDDTVAEIETDKTSIPIPAPQSGVIEVLLVEDGTTVTPGTPLFKLNTDGAAPAAEKPKAPESSAPPPESTTQPEPEKTPAPEPVKIPETMPPPTPVSTKPISTVKVSDIKPTLMTMQESSAPPSGTRSESRVKMNRMRLRIAQRLKDSQNTAAMLTTFNEVDMSNIMAMRNKYKDAFLKKHGLKLSFMSAFIKASAYALKDQPVVNAVIDDASSEIVYKDYVDISVAVSTEKGLVVPVIRNCETMDYLDVEREMTNLAVKARNNELTVEDMDGGTFTISNGGVFGSLYGTPIINPPQSAILGMHGIFDRPVAIKGEVKIRPMMYIALTYDHRLVDGREAVTFLKKIKESVEDPHVLLLRM